MPGRVLVTSSFFDPADPATAGRLREAGLEVDFAPLHGSRTPEELVGLLGDAVAAVVSTDPFTAAVLERAPRLRVVARVGVGYDTVDVDAAAARGIAVTTTPGANDDSVADHAVGLMLAVTRRIVEQDAAVRRGDWTSRSRLIGWDLYGKTVGVVGLGRIGLGVARRLRGFSTHVLATDPVVASSDHAELVPLDELLERADLVTLHVPLSPATRGLLGARELALLKPEAILVNTSRGGVVDEAALAEALAAGRLRGAGLDVFEDEPPPRSALFELPNVVLTPHLAGVTAESAQRMLAQAVECVLDVLAGRPSSGLVPPLVPAT